MKYILNAVLLSMFTAVSLYASGLKTAAPVVKMKPIMTVEYEYSKSGRITARKINGQVQNYKYDKKGQLLGVYDDKGNAIEEYVYDPAGNILKKTIQGRTTTYKYDKANQLVSSECNGKVTKYEYDAAGRLVKEGDKEYHYIGLDKIESVTENGRRLSSFTYHIDGQLAACVSIESSEEFQWDGLALIQRNSTNYVNEPAVTGGNPILADDKVLFNDMLGTTLGIKDGDKVMQNNLTAFGESLSASLMEDSFFTGKPHVGEMGYVFLFRAYRADQGKWNSQDPVALAMALPTATDFSRNSSFVKALGYPDGWNNLAYCNNGVTMYFDFLGGEIGDGKWEWEPAGPDDDQRFELTDDYYVGENPYKIVRNWVHIRTFLLGSAYMAEAQTYSFSITVGCTGGLEIPGLGLSISQSTSETVSYSFSTGKGERAQYSLYQLVETYQFFENGVVARTVVAQTNTISRVVKGWKWLE